MTSKFRVTGNITKDAEVQTAASNIKYAHLTIASDRSKSESAKTDFFRVSFIGEAAEQLETLALKKGEFVTATCRIKTGEYDGKQTVEILGLSVARFETKEAAA